MCYKNARSVHYIFCEQGLRNISVKVLPCRHEAKFRTLVPKSKGQMDERRGSGGRE